MVGIAGRTSTHGTESLREHLDGLHHTDRHESTVVYDDGTHTYGHTSYPEYPIETFEIGDRFVYLEGRLYDVPDAELAAELDPVTARMLADEPDTEALAEWLLGIDGEFLLVAIDRESGELAALNDPLARLPTYLSYDADSFSLSRELRYVIEGVDLEFDRIGVAQCLLFGYSLGRRTLVRNVERLRPGTLLQVDPEGVQVTETSLHTFSFDDHRHAGRRRERNAAALVSRFRRACRRRAGAYDHDVVSLSGGLDSRSVLAGYHVEGLSPVAATMESPAYVPESDVEIAGQLAADFGVDWRRYPVSHPSGADLETLVRSKNGQIGLRTSFILEFFRQLEADFDPSMAYITGDGGDKTLPDLTPAGRLGDDELLEYLLAHESVLEVETVAELIDESAAAIRRSVREHVESYPERSAAGKYVHFLLYERGVNFLFEGEDRNRQFFWSVTPFYALPFFRYAMNCPPGQKRRYGLYRAFLEELSPEAAERVHPIYGAPPSSGRHAVAALADDVLSRYPSLLETVKPLIKAVNDLDTESTDTTATVDCIHGQLERCDAVGDLFEERALRRFLAADHDAWATYRLFAITSFVDDLYSDPSLLSSRRNVVFA